MGGTVGAWGDESMRVTNVSEPMYLLGVALADEPTAERAREAMHSIHKAGPKLHWRDLEPKAKARSVETVGSLGLDHLVVVAAPLDPRRQERARAKCLERLCWEVQDLGGSRVVLESRTESLNQRDRNLIPKLRGQNALPMGLRVDWQLGSEEPMLWIADQVLGAYGDAQTGETQYLSIIEQDIAVCPIKL
ncbi:hypothetical protein SAMN04488693_1292 [Arthrobacter subterraneus]|uniref:Uncharacterized protein n=1 Tax=Arthrobacter subterraneus TaxID=335973 RepID=A0A1G8P439_9MICC|nr:hypothetical protein [Arthrobacter subterraneus]SDI87048.1 hypothetical protein SAMN04488693_1292 [Arthrobacter subterraneus]